MPRSTDDTIVIEYPSMGETYSRPCYGVYAYGTYPRGSVLAGQERRTFINIFETLEAAQAAFPNAEWHDDGSHYTPLELSTMPPDWFDPTYAGERWNEED